jgi:CRP/FNR family transcriptional regulator, anaerobic regulatory protein
MMVKQLYMVQKMIDYFNSLNPMSPQLCRAIAAVATLEDYPKKAILLKEGQTANHACFVVKGLTRAYYNSGNKEVTRLFMDEGYIITSWLSFYTRMPAHETIEVLEDATLACLHHDDIENLYAEFPEFNIVGKKAVEYFFALSEQRSLMLRKHSAEEKYHFFIERHPTLFQRISQKQIATFLGMNEETLSRIRAKMLKKG